ncbi:MAG: glycine zipper 2TM domain-containing protein [Nevskiaceae bacterium]|nr:MAG: glycine zipper 2TM domain-containing protein [Nevskiaceae bacterium]
MKIRNLALALIVGSAVGFAGCSQNQQSDTEKELAAQQAADAQQKLQDAEKAADDARKAAADAEARAKSAERKADRATRAVSAPASAPAVCSNCGTVTAVTAIKQKPDGSGAGAVLGAAAGGVAGHQVGGGRGKDVATVLGALAGAYAGNQAEKAIRAETVYQVDVRMDDGSSRQITVKDASGLAVGSKVRVSGDTIEPRG